MSSVEGEEKRAADAALGEWPEALGVKSRLSNYFNRKSHADARISFALGWLACVKSREAHVEPAWTKTPPTDPGWYWVKIGSGNAHPRYVDLRDQTSSFQFIGPDTLFGPRIEPPA